MPTSPRRPRLVACLLAVAGSLLLHLAIMLDQGIFPLGTRARGMGDYGPQYVPFHQALAAALHGSPLVGPGFNWLSGAGVPSLADYATYTASPFSLLVALFPVEHAELALTCAVVMKVCLAAGTMTLLLVTLTPVCKHWPAALLGIAYSTSAWVFDISIYTPQWLDGMLGFPLLCLVGLWCSQRRHPWLGVAIVAETWWANYYSAYMASLGAAVFLVIWLAAGGRRLGHAVGDVMRFALVGVGGILLTSPILIPAVLAVSHGVPYGGAGLPTVTLDSILVRLLPYTEGVAGTPALAANSACLVLALSLPWKAGLSRRQRVVWLTVPLLLLGSIMWEPTLRMWNVFDVPNGNPYRFSFVLIGILLVMSWLSLQDSTSPEAKMQGAPGTRWPHPLALAISTALVLLLAHAAPAVHVRFLRISPDVQWPPTIVALVMLATSLLRGRLRQAGVAIVIVITALETVGSARFIDESARRFLATAPVHDLVADAALQRSEQAVRQATWPGMRVSSTRWPNKLSWMSFNMPMMLLYPSVGYYSSTLPLDVSSTLQGLGVAARARGRMLIDTSDPGLDPLLAIRVRGTDPLFHGTAGTPAFSMVRAVGDPKSSLPGLPHQFANRNTLLDTPVYSPATATHFSQPTGPGGVIRIPAGHTVSMSSSCPARTLMQVLMEPGEGLVQWEDPAKGSQRMGLKDRRVVTLGSPVPGSVRITGTGRGTAARPNSVACLDAASLQEQVRRSTRPAIDINGPRITARFARPVVGDVLIATTYQSGWTCSLDGHSAEARGRSGLLSIHANGNTMVECRHRTAGARPGVALGLVTLALLGLLRWQAGPGSLLRRRCGINQRMARRD